MSAPEYDLRKTADELIADMHRIIVEGGSPTNPGFNTRKGIEALQKFACVLTVTSRAADIQTRRIVRLTWGLVLLTVALLVFTVSLQRNALIQRANAQQPYETKSP
jgi:hypothetical protein